MGQLFGITKDKYIDLEIDVDNKIRPGIYQIRAKSSNGHEVEDTINLPIDNEIYKAMLIKLEYPEINTTNKEICDFGNLLYNTLFSGKILAIFISMRDQAERENRELRMKLVIPFSYRHSALTALTK